MSESIEIEEKEKERTFKILKNLKELLMKGVFESFNLYFEDLKISENEFKELVDGYINKYAWYYDNINTKETFEYPYKRRIYFEYSVEEKNNEKMYDILYIKGYFNDSKRKKRKIGERTQKKILKNLIELTEQFKEGKYDRFDINFTKYPEIREIDFEGLIKDYKGIDGFFINPKIAVDGYYYNLDLKVSDNTYDILFEKIYLAYSIKENDNDVSNPKIYIIHYIGGRKEGFLKEKI
jgi:hypothetical protein